MPHTPAPLTAAARRAIAKYGADACRTAFEMHARDGNGAAYVAQCGPATIRTTRQADAAINAGRELAAQVPA